MNPHKNADLDWSRATEAERQARDGARKLLKDAPRGPDGKADTSKLTGEQRQMLEAFYEAERRLQT